MTKYKEYFQMMLDQHKDEFDKFRDVHMRYENNPSETQEEFNQKGENIMLIIRDWEDKLCGRSEGSGYGAYTGNLADKFQEEIRKEFPMIDRVGVIISSSPPAHLKSNEANEIEINQITPLFDLKKINL